MMRLAWGKAVKPLLIMWGVSSVLFLGVPHVLAGGWKAIPFVLMMGGIFTLILGVPAVFILLVVDAARDRRRRESQ